MILLLSICAVLAVGGTAALLSFRPERAALAATGIGAAAVLVALGLASHLGALAILPPAFLAAGIPALVTFPRIAPDEASDLRVVVGIVVVAAVLVAAVFMGSKAVPAPTLRDIDGVWKTLIACVAVVAVAARLGVRSLLQETEAERARTRALEQRHRRRSLQAKSKLARDAAREERRRALDEKRQR